MTSAERIRTNLGRVYGRASTPLLNAVLGAWGTGIDRGHLDGGYAIAELDFQTVGGRWLTQWGDHFAVPRGVDAETDHQYATKIIAETVRQRPQIHALEQLLQHAFDLNIALADLYPYVLHYDQWTTPPGHPPQLCDAHLLPGFNGPLPDQAVRCDALPPYVPGAFGVWMTVEADDPYLFTLDQIIAFFPLVLITDQHLTGMPPYTQVCDGHLTSVDLSGGPADTARKMFGRPSIELPVTEADVLALLTRHRSAGTKAVIMQVTVT